MTDRKHFVVYGAGLSLGLTDNIAASTNAVEIPSSQGTYISGGQPFVEFWPKTAGYTDEQIRDNKASMNGSVVTIVQSIGPNYSENFAYAKLAADDAKRFGAKVVHMVFPFYDLREDKDFPNRGTSFANPIYAKELVAAGVDFVTFMAPHSKAGVAQFAKVFGKNISVVELQEILVPVIQRKFGGDVTHVVNGAPDGWNKQDDQALGCAFAIAEALHGNNSNEHLFGIEKHRIRPGESVSKWAHGNVAGKIVITADDMFDGGGTSIDAGILASDNGAAQVYLTAGHGIFSKGLAPFLSAKTSDGAPLVTQVITTNTLAVEEAIKAARRQFPNIKDRVLVADVSSFVVREMKHVLAMADQVARESMANKRNAIER